MMRFIIIKCFLFLLLVTAAGANDFSLPCNRIVHGSEPVTLQVASVSKHVDKYGSYAELAFNHVYGVDYSIQMHDRNSPITVVAPHGGLIESGTGELAAEIAGNDLNLYVFQGHLIGRRNFDLHITSANFDEPLALSLVGKSQFAVSIHGYKELFKKEVCVGGGNYTAAKKVATSLSRAGFAVIFPCIKYPGRNENNIVNRARSMGVQIELSSRLRYVLLNNKKTRTEFVESVRKGLP